MIFKATTFIISLLLIGLPLSVWVAAYAERKYLESKSGARYAELKAFAVWVASLLIIFSFIFILTSQIAEYL